MHLSRSQLATHALGVTLEPPGTNGRSLEEIEDVDGLLVVVDEGDQGQATMSVEELDVERLELVETGVEFLFLADEVATCFFLSDEDFAVGASEHLVIALELLTERLNIESMLAERTHDGSDIRGGSKSLFKDPGSEAWPTTSGFARSCGHGGISCLVWPGSATDVGARLSPPTRVEVNR